MNDELETKIRQRAHEMWEGEGRPEGLAGRHWLAAEREVTEEAENAAVSRWATPVRGSHVETCNETARAAEAVRHPVARPPSGAPRAPTPDGRFFSRSAVPARAGREGLG
jgi:hypothetical protein